MSAAVQSAKLDGVTMRVLEFEVTSENFRGQPPEKKEPTALEEEPEVYIKSGKTPPLIKTSPVINMKVVRVDTKSWSKKNAPTFAHTNTIKNVGVDLQTLLTLGTFLRLAITFFSYFPAIFFLTSFYSFFLAGLVKQQKKTLFRMYLSLPFTKIESNEGLSSKLLPSSIHYIGHGGGKNKNYPQLIFVGSSHKIKSIYRGTCLPPFHHYHLVGF